MGYDFEYCKTSQANVDIHLKRYTQCRIEKHSGRKLVIGQGFEVPKPNIHSATNLSNQLSFTCETDTVKPYKAVFIRPKHWMNTKYWDQGRLPLSRSKDVV